MRVLVCVKRVPAPGAKINITADGQAVDSAYLAFTTSPHEECAVEEAVRLVEAHGGESTVLTLGPSEAEEQLRYAASIGINKCVFLPTETADWDPQRTAAAISTGAARLSVTPQSQQPGGYPGAPAGPAHSLSGQAGSAQSGMHRHSGRCRSA